MPTRPTSGAVAIIPARLQSTRLPEKPLQDLGGKPLVVRVLERARRATSLEAVWVATDSERIVKVVGDAGGETILTRADHPAGLDRVAEAAIALCEMTRRGSQADGVRDPDLAADPVILNVQGDEPFLNPAGLDHLVSLFDRPEVRMATLAAPFAAGDDPADPNRVKVVLDRMGRALYFSRSLIPHGAGGAPPGGAQTGAAQTGAAATTPLLHVGIYAYRLTTLRELAALPPAPLETCERLEQLRALWNGIPIHVAVGDYHSIGIDTPEDLARARTRWSEGGAS
ncbi:MAG TPA: 3-deoxy-manno-octulosonate cytidylyltransferase [Candidatus Eisenbacteria bacterium]|nr:3-deoxy-manno-octulosonate cytidylyltransferase [Candidatus Eisenbacteria bacterium]